VKNKGIEGMAPGPLEVPPAPVTLQYTGAEPGLWAEIGYPVNPGQVVQNVPAASAEVLLGTGLWVAVEPAGKE